jgi:AraC-like DNA-binding protein
LVIGTDLILSEIAAQTGFSDQSHLARRFRQQHGVPPSAIRRSLEHEPPSCCGRPCDLNTCVGPGATSCRTRSAL